MIVTIDYTKERRQVVEVAAFCVSVAAATTTGVLWCIRRLSGRSGWLPTTARGTLYIVLSLVLLTCVAIFYLACTGYADGKRKDLESHRNARAPLRQQIRGWIAYLDNEWSWLLDTPEELRQEWATRRFREVILHWPEDLRRFETMFQAEEFPVAIREEGAPATRMLKIWRLRTGLYKWARLNVTPVERVTLTLETSNEINLKKLEAGKALQDFTRANPSVLLFPPDEREEAGS